MARACRHESRGGSPVGVMSGRSPPQLAGAGSLAALSEASSGPGSGLGLSLAKAVMKFHRGRLDLLPGRPGLTVAMGFPLPRGER